MSNHKQIMEDSTVFFINEVDKIINKITTTKSSRLRDKYIKQMEALKKRMEYEVKIIEQFEN